MNTTPVPPQPGFGESVDTSSVDVKQSTARYLVVPESDRKKPASAAEIFTANMEKIERRVLQIAQGQDSKNRAALLKMFDLMKKMQADSGGVKGISPQAISSKDNSNPEALVQREEQTKHEIENLNQRAELAEKKAEQIAQHAKGVEQELAKMRQSLSQLNERIVYDELTETLNLRGFEDAFRIESVRAVREGRPLSLILFDLKKTRQTHSNLQQTELNIQALHFTKIVQFSVRPHDAFARIGEMEFAVLLPGASIDNASQIMDRLLQEQKHRSPIFNGQSFILQVHTGMAAVEKGSSLKTVLKHARQAIVESEAKNEVLPPVSQSEEAKVAISVPLVPSAGILSSLKGSLSKYRKK